MKLEVGMYVRTKYGITQYKEYETTNGNILCMPIKDGTNIIFANIKDIIGKPSFSIIELLEVGDYVNGKEVIWVSEGDIKCIQTFPIENDFIHEKDVKSIVTKEQFEAMQYKID